MTLSGMASLADESAVSAAFGSTAKRLLAANQQQASPQEDALKMRQYFYPGKTENYKNIVRVK
jgi:hypothetical protein